jgi:heat shock protein HtpX
MWEQIQANRRRSAILVTGLGLVLLILGYCAGEGFGGPGAGWIGLLTGLVIWLVQMATCFLAADSIVLHGTFARELQREDSPRLFNVVEEMKLASGLGFLPRIFLIDDSSPNAFAFGLKPEKSAVAVTTGLVHRLNRDELQGVIAHEISHLKNRDVQFMTLAAATLGAIIVMSNLVGRMMRTGSQGRSRSSSRGGGQAQLIFFLIAILFAILGPVVAQMLYFACSRKREYLADACSAQFTRYPEGLASALEKIANANVQVAFASQVTAPMFIVNPLAAAGSGFSLFSTHPPVEQRIQILRGMAGGSLADYEAAYRQSLGKGLIGRRSLLEAPSQPIREPSVEGTVETHRDMQAMSHRLNGYLTLQCPCGMELSVPRGYERDEVRCVRCGRSLPLPAVSTAATVPEGTMTDQEAPSPAKEPALQYTRTSPGWQTFRCKCNHTIHLSPSFNAESITCPGCGSKIGIS